MKDSIVHTSRPENVRDLSAAVSGAGLQELVGLIDDEITDALRFQQDVDSFADESDGKENIGRYICLELAGKRMAIPLTSILEAGELQVVQPLPLLPDWLSGITNIRGEIVSVVNLGLFLGSKDSLPAAEQSYLVVYNDEIKVAITVDGIIGTRSLYRLQTEQSQRVSNRSQPAKYFGGWAVYQERDSEKEISLFDLDDFLSSDKLLNVANA